jgi:O-antigen/teichoic acid export membrane protein
MTRRGVWRPAAGWTLLRLSADVIGRILQLMLLIAVARRFDEATFGTLMVGATAGLVVAQAADLGLGLVVASDVARRLPQSLTSLGTALAIKVVLSAIGCIVLVGLYPLLGGTSAAAGAVLLAAAFSLDTFVQFSATQLRAAGAFVLDWTTAVIPRLLGLLIVVPVVLSLPVPRMVGFSWLIASLASGGIGVWILATQVTPRSPSFTVARSLVARAWPIGASILVSMLYTRVAIFILEGVRSSQEVAAYAVAVRMTDPLYLIPAAMSAIFYPAYVKNARSRPDAARAQLWRAIIGAAAAAAVCYAGLAILGRPVAALLFGDFFAVSGELVALLGLILIPGFISFLLNQALIARGLARYNLFVMGGLLVVSLIANWWAISTYGIWGAAAVAVGVEWLLLIALSLRMILAHRQPADV